MSSTAQPVNTLSDAEWTAYASGRSTRHAKRKLTARGLTQVPEHEYPSTPIETPQVEAPADAGGDVPEPRRRSPTPLVAPTAPRIKKRRRYDTTDMTETRSSKHSRVPYPTTALQHERHRRRDQSTTAPADTSSTPITFRHTRRPRRANAAAPSTSPPPDRIAARTRDRHVHAAPRRVNQQAPVVPSPNNQHPNRAATTETATTTENTPVTNRANAAVELFLRQYDAARATAPPTPVPPDRAYDAVMQHLDYCLVTDPDTTRVTEPFALRLGPRAVLHKWKK
ncbi:hypothetical protein EDB89DRAFT_1914926 [Lactarius sanguifluus]|nr:hypothetical protein EDB89DRAFT_1914926 [Lactarius sanguifluus]